MKYEKSAATSGISCLVWGVGILLVMGAVQIFGLNPNDVPAPLVVLFWFFGLIPVAICVGVGVMLIRKGGSWKIVIDREGVDWSSPCESVDASFQIAMEDINRVETRISKSGSSGSSWVTHYLVSHSGAEQKLGAGSDIDLRDVVAELERLGVTHEVVNMDKRIWEEAKAKKLRKKELEQDRALSSHA